MTADELEGIEQGLHWHKPAARERLAQLIAEVRRLEAMLKEFAGAHAVAQKQAAWLREVTLERDALKLRVAELEEAERMRDEAMAGRL